MKEENNKNHDSNLHGIIGPTTNNKTLFVLSQESIEIFRVKNQSMTQITESK